MRWKAPDFWWRHPPSLPARFLHPLGLAYSWGAHFSYTAKERFFSPPVSCPYPVISVGNAVMGGAGKTPLTLALATFLQDNGCAPVIITRGFGGNSKHAGLVKPEKDSVATVGDEALFLAGHFPTYRALYRATALQHLPPCPSCVVLLDDGHQHTSMKKDMSLLVIDADQALGNEKVFPSGPLRENLNTSIARATALVLIGKNPELFEKMATWNRPLLQATVQPISFCDVKQPVLAFAGLGYPLKFLKTLEKMQMNVVDFKTFPDHYPYTSLDMNKLKKAAEKYGAQLLTTEKDWIRVPRPNQPEVGVVKIRICFQSEDQLHHLLHPFFPDDGRHKDHP